MGDLSSEAVMRLLTRMVPALARRAVVVPVKRFGTVASSGAGPALDVMVDGDTRATSILNATGLGLAAGQRVVVDFYPPSGAVISGVLGPITPAVDQVFTSTYSVPDDPTNSEPSASWAEVTDEGVGWTIDGGDLACTIGGLWLVSLQATFTTNGSGTHRAAALASADGTQRARTSHQFTGPGGVPTAGYGLAGSGWGYWSAVPGDTLTGLARQDSGTALSVTLFAHLRLITAA